LLECVNGVVDVAVAELAGDVTDRDVGGTAD
jgi:hypothetical protein